MPAERKPARLKQWRGKWYIFYTDFTVSPPKERRASCGKRDKEARRAMLKEYARTEKRENVAAEHRGGGAAFQTRLIDAMDRFIKRSRARVKARESNPAARAEGLSPVTLRGLEATHDRFKAWIEDTGRARLHTGDLTGSVLEEYRLHYATGNRSAATIAGEVRNLRAMLRWIDSQRPPMFRDFAYTISPALKPGPGGESKGLAFTPEELRAFLRSALERESPDFKADVKRKKRGRVENFKQGPSVTSATPVSRLFILAALTGARLGELLALKWEHLDLERGRITIHASKTGHTRILPLMGAPEGDVAPVLVDLLRHWKLEAGTRQYVLPHGDLDHPVFPKSGWLLTQRMCKSSVSGPQKLRKNFTSYAASLGIPATVAALWQGHAAEVASKYYRMQVLDRQQAPDLAGAMGLVEFLLELAGSRPQRRVTGKKR